MKILSLDFSTPNATLAATDGPRLLALEHVNASRHHCMDLFPAAERLLAAAHWTFADVQRYVVGRGPGAYTGLRVSLTAALAWALPRHTPLHTIPSPAALALDALSTDPSRPVATSGDARRGHIWCALFAPDPHTLVRQITPFTLLPAGALPAHCPNARCLPPDASPSADRLARLSLAHYPNAPLQPLYLHPPVATPPHP